MKSYSTIQEESEIYVGGVAEILPGALPDDGRVVVVTDRTVDKLYGQLFAAYDKVFVGRGEKSKTMKTVEDVCRQFIALGVDRSTFVLGVGGGIVTDVAGFAASTYMRGLDFGFIATTLLAQVDAAIGGKNGVNIDGYKNMAGTFSHPRFVICDPALLRSLPDREFRAGLAELVKASVIADAELFSRIEALSFKDLHTDEDLLSDAISAAVRVKADIVERDPHEENDRRKLNLGHTIAHAIEKCSDKLTHGEAVAVGIALISDVAVKLGKLTSADRDRIVTLLKRFGFDLTPPVPVAQLLEEVDKDKKNADGILRIVLPVGIGDCIVQPLKVEEFKALF